MYSISKPKIVSVSADDIFNSIQNEFIDTKHKLGFRGHQNSSWILQPTLGRFLDKISKPQDDARETKYDLVQREIYDLFRESVIINNDINSEEIDRIDLWQFGQHHGLPTPLLDWTYSAYISLFFSLRDDALSNPDQNGERCIWALDIDLLKHLNMQILETIRPKIAKTIKSEIMLAKQVPEMEVVREINGENKRIAYQQGFFTKHIFYRSFEIWSQRIASELAHSEFSDPLLTKLCFSVCQDQKSKFLRILDQMNINDRSLFPDITGSVNHVKFVLEHQIPRTSITFSARKPLEK